MFRYLISLFASFLLRALAKIANQFINSFELIVSEISTAATLP